MAGKDPTSHAAGNAGSGLPARPVEKLTRHLERFLHTQAAGGLVLLGATAVALAMANSPLAAAYRGFWDTRAAVGVGELTVSYPLWYWVNDGLMAIFFFVIGLEIKRELLWGELRDRRSAVLPAAAALGGAVVPVGLYLLLQRHPPASEAWAVPMATDIAFVVGCMALLGSRVPAGLKVFVLSLAILDDILAVMVIAIFFSGQLQAMWLIGAAAGFAITTLLNRLGVRRVSVYVLVGVAIWFCTLKSGIHPTVAGALLGLLTPASAWVGTATLLEVIERVVGRLKERREWPSGSGTRAAAQELSFAATESVAPLDRLEHALHPWVSFAIMPVFALANAGVAIDAASASHPVALSVAAGLVAGKPLGITSASWIAVRLGIAQLPTGTSWRAILGSGCLAGIGFTMALFIASLSLTSPLLEAAKSGILMGSGLSLLLGLALLALALRPGSDARGATT